MDWKIMFHNNRGSHVGSGVLCSAFPFVATRGRGRTLETRVAIFLPINDESFISVFKFLFFFFFKKSTSRYV